VPRLPGFLDRFRRRLGPPGRPSEAVGVPTSGDDLESEIAPLLDRLEEVGREAAAIRDEGRRQAERRREAGLREAAAILQEARERADAVRARAALELRDEAERNGRVAREEARREVERLARIREERLAEMLARVLECVRRSTP
jgi:hypothetical protein